MSSDTDIASVDLHISIVAQITASIYLFIWYSQVTTHVFEFYKKLNTQLKMLSLVRVCPTKWQVMSTVNLSMSHQLNVATRIP